VRVTGGEPLVTPKFDDLLRGVMPLELKDVSITTNGQLLMADKEVIKASGIKRLNILLDTLNPRRFKKLPTAVTSKQCSRVSMRCSGWVLTLKSIGCPWLRKSGRYSIDAGFFVLSAVMSSALSNS
jgi:uncharacterized Fe-S cluster-containing radical SAM superfamily protein